MQNWAPFKELQQVLPVLTRDQIQTLRSALKRENRIHNTGVTSGTRWYVKTDAAKSD